MKILRGAMVGSYGRRVAMCALFLAVAVPVSAQLPSSTPSFPAPGDEESPELAPDETGEPAAEDPTQTAGGALKVFMGSRDYRTLRQLKAVMTEKLQARFDHDSAPFNGKRNNRLVAFQFTEKDLKPTRPVGNKPAGAAAPGYVATVRSLWAEQGEATEIRTESVTLTQREDGLWRVAGLAQAPSEKLRFAETVDGVTALRMVLRAWIRGEGTGARSSLSDAFLKRYAGRDEALAALFAPSGGKAHAAYQIVEMTPRQTTGAVARVRFYETVIGEPVPIDGKVRVLKLIHKGSRWLVDAWE
jgi:hypothetical protein